MNEVLAKAYPGVSSFVLDAEIVLMDTRTNRPLPFGSLSKHKQKVGDDAIS